MAMTTIGVIADADRYWLAGLLEGEGSFVKAPPSNKGRPIVQLSMTDEDIVARAAGICGVSYHQRVWKIDKNPAAANWRPALVMHVQGRRAVELMLMLHPLMGERRRRQIVAALASWETNPRIRKVTRDQGDAIIAASRNGEHARVLAERFNVSRASIYAIRQGNYFGWSDAGESDPLKVAVAQLVGAPS